MIDRTKRSSGEPVWLLLVVVIALLGATQPALGAKKIQTAPDVYGPSKVWQVHITMAPEEYEAMQPRGGRGFPGFGAPREPERPADSDRELHRNTFGVDLPWATGSIVMGDESFENVGIRYKGNGTIGDTTGSIKKSFKIDLDRRGGSGRFGGSKTINLHCGVTDPSKCRETLGYELYREAGVPAPRTALAEVHITVPGKHENELLGLYTIVEEVDKPFLRDRFGADRGLLMKPEGVRDFEDQGDDWESYDRAYEPKRKPTKAEADRIVAFARLIQASDDAAFAREIDSYLDIDNYLRYLATTSFLANSDSFFVLGHNYYLYLDAETNRLLFIPWDLDRAFANFPILGSNTQQMDLSLTHPYGGNHRLTERLLAVPGVSERYRELLEELAGTAFDKERLLARLQELEGETAELVERDREATAARKERRGGFGPPGFGNPPALDEFIEKRTASVAAQIAGTSKGHVPTGGFGFGRGPGGPPPFGPIMAGMMIQGLDEDKDERLSRDEWLAAMGKLLDACEKDEEGNVDEKSLVDGLNSLMPAPPEGAPRRGFGPGNFLAGAIVTKSDENKDGKVAREELIAAASAVFDKQDEKKAEKLDEEALGELLTSLFPAPRFGPPPGGPGPGAPPRGRE